MRGGNFAFIAENVSVIYSVLRETDYGRSLSEGQLFYAVSLIDTAAYLASEQISRSDLEIGSLAALGNSIDVHFVTRQIYDLFAFRENSHLVCLAMQIEALVFCADNTRFDYHRVIDMVISKKALIERVVDRTVAQPRKALLYNQMRLAALHLAEDPSFREEVSAFRD